MREDQAGRIKWCPEAGLLPRRAPEAVPQCGLLEGMVVGSGDAEPQPALDMINGRSADELLIVEAYGGSRLVVIVPRQIETRVLRDPVHPRSEERRVGKECR